MTEHFKLLRGVRRNSDIDIKKALPEDAKVLSAIPQNAIPNSIAVIYSLPDKQHGKSRKPSAVSKPGNIVKPRIDVP